MNYEKTPYSKRYRFSDIFLNQRVLAVFGLAILTIITIPLIRNYNQKKMIGREIAEMENEIARVENKNNDLRKLIEYFESDQFIEEQARMNFGLKKGGEQVAVIKGPISGLTADVKNLDSKDQIFNIPGLEKQIAPKTQNNPSKWWNHYFRK